ncbi:MAG: hypothetical protein ACI9RM_001079 [Ulvibacter sp.]|jgi:hypothetical protein
MKDNSYKNRVGTSNKQKAISISKTDYSQNEVKLQLKQKLLPLFILTVIGSWISLCINNGNFLLDKALMSSFIILCLLFFNLVDQD